MTPVLPSFLINMKAIEFEKASLIYRKNLRTVF